MAFLRLLLVPLVVHASHRPHFAFRRLQLHSQNEERYGTATNSCSSFMAISCFAIRSASDAMHSCAESTSTRPTCPATTNWRSPMVFCGRTEEAQAEAAIVKADWPSVSTGFILDRSLAAIYSRGNHVAGLD